jgi:hypothetical protein
MFRSLAPDDGHGQVTLVGLEPDAPRRRSALTCVRLHYAGGRGLCARQETVANRLQYAVYLFDRGLRPGRRIALDAIPVRLRVAPRGQVGAITTYIEEEIDDGERLAMSTHIVDMRSGRVVANLEDFQIENHNLPPLTAPIDVAGVAFEPDGDRFFATVATPLHQYLVAGSLRERRLTTLRTGIATEALSPDGRRLVVKRLIPERGFWQLAVIDLGTWAEHDLQQGPRSVDDQVEWLDNEHVLYHDVADGTTALWMLPADGTGPPRVFMRDAYSGVVQR